MVDITNPLIISGFSSRLSGYELYARFRAITRSDRYIFLYAVLNASRSVSRYFRIIPGSEDIIVLNVNIGLGDDHSLFLLQLGAMRGCINTAMVREEKIRFMNIIRSFKGIYVVDGLTRIDSPS